MPNSKIFGHQDFYVINKFDNIHTRIKTGYDYEQINVVKIIGKLSAKLSKTLNYNKSIFLDFNHAYIEDIEADYFISFGKGKIKYTWTNDKQKGLLKLKGIVIRQVSHEFDIEATLKLIEYSISNLSKIKQNQKEIIYEQNYCQWKIPTIDTLEIQKIISLESSSKIDQILSQKTYLNSPNWNFGVDYFYQKRQFHFLVKAYNGVKDTIALSTKGIFQVANIDSGTKLIFDSDSTFYCVGWHGNERVVSKKHTITKVKDNFETFNINNIGDNLISIHLRRFSSKEEQEKNQRNFYFEKTSIYDERNDYLINDIREKIKK